MKYLILFAMLALPVRAETNITGEVFRGIYRSIGAHSYVGKFSAEQIFNLSKFKYNMKYVDGDGGTMYSHSSAWTKIVKDNYYYKTAYRYQVKDTLYKEHTGALDLGYKIKKQFPFMFDCSLGYNAAYIDDLDHLAALKFNCFISEKTSLKWHMRSNFNDRPYEYWVQAEYIIKLGKWYRMGFKYQWDYEHKKLDEELTFFITFKSGGI